MRIIICGGGTGGHIYPAIAIAEKLKEQNANHEILFIGGKGKMEISKVRDAGFPIAKIWIDGLNRKNLLKNIFLPFKLAYSWWKTRRIIKYFKPDIVVGTGGYVTGPIIRTAHNLHVPTVILEQNAVPGLANRLLAKNADKIIVAYESAAKYFEPHKVKVLGNPLRKHITSLNVTKAKAMKYFGFDPKKKCILVLGGSLGAKTINDCVMHGYEKLLHYDIQVIWQTGKYYYDSIKNKLPEEFTKNIIPIDYLEDIRIAYTAADIVIARAGALTISEVAALKKPTIFVPSPNVANDHQTKNVEELINKDAAISIKDKEAKKHLIDVAIKLVFDNSTQKLLSKNIGELFLENSVENIVDIIESLPYNIDGTQFAKKVKTRYKYVYFVGVGGIGMSSLAQWFNNMNLKILGYDQVSTKLTTNLKLLDISIGFEDGIRFIPREILDNPDKTLVIYTPAIPKTNEILNHMYELGIPTYKRSTILGKISEDNFTIAIAGTHGKTTTCAILAHIVYQSKKPMKAFIGGILKKFNNNFITNIRKDKKSITIVEADEYDKSFLKLYPKMSIITSVDPDHMEIYKTKKGIDDGFSEFSNLLEEGGKLIIDDSSYKKIKKNISPDLQDHALIYNNDKNIYAHNIRYAQGYMLFDYYSPEIILNDLQFSLPGEHNVSNAVAAITASLLLDIKPEVISKALASFPGIKRRFEYIINDPKVVFINDYAHHPTEITSLVQSVKKMYPKSKITVIFQPHLYSRTKFFAAGFAKSLQQADEVFILPIYPAREEPIKGVTSKIIFSKMKSKSKKKKLCTKEELLDIISKNTFKPEIILTVGAGDIDDLVDPIAHILKDKFGI